MKNYFKKFSIMFVMALMFIGIGMIQNGNVANAATVGQQLTKPEIGWQRYDSSDSRITSNGVVYDPGRYGGSVSTNPILKFYGSKIRIIDAHFPSGYTSNTIVTIDGVKYPSFSSIGSTLYQAMVFEKTNLNLGVHTVSINNGYLDAVDIDDTGHLINSNESITLDKSALNLTEGYSQQISATTTPAGEQVTWSSSDPSIASVDSTGKVTGVKEGTCTITATTADGLTATCTVTVTKENKSISLNKSTTNLTIGDSETLISTTTPAGINVKWSSSDTSVATVDSNGKVTTIGAGTATITATTLDGSNLSATCVVTVTPKGTDPNPQPTDTDKIVNIAHAKGDNTNNAGGDVTIIFHGSADTNLSVVKTADVKEVWIGDNFTYTLVITNTGTKTAKAVVVNDPAPNHIDFNVSGVTTTQGSVDSSSTSKNIIVNVGDIPPAGTVTIKVPATVIL
ncbi:Ig-like domain-containing protein [Clostridium saccharoperbutylacetonicum]|uniref:Ig-like domain-containing protein n=1 Tax=Clostridium saccharoperbutylacetonicum TaxID=36745 RepID=UPI00156F9756|nr:Ig-like domain-containing protein [Clostridium saccharoperbutylacetonicum]NSB30235.1 putative repeat protein (TIGR01451 family) [Clostridium saccharoperbutylacetonicum]